MEFKVKRDYLIITIVNMALLFLMFVPFVGLFTEYKEAAIFFFILFGFVLALFILYNTAVIFSSLELQDNVLLFRSGAFKKVVFLDKLVSVTKLNTLAGSLFLSTKRIELIVMEKEKRVYYYVSAVDNEKLFELLSAKLPKKHVSMPEAKVEKLEGKKETVSKKVTTVKTAKKPTSTAKKPVAKKATTTKKTATSSTKKPAAKKPVAKK